VGAWVRVGDERQSRREDGKELGSLVWQAYRRMLGFCIAGCERAGIETSHSDIPIDVNPMGLGDWTFSRGQKAQALQPRLCSGRY
jgi:hypothetical protein